tara:strand:- start:71985 stop:73886 length:1902 start_codon:yes stop_codon:yes gene_type:complete
MITIHLPDGNSRQFDQALSVFDVAKDIAPGLAKAALAGKVDGEMVDTSYVIDRDVQLAIITDKEPEGLDVIRHSAAHLLAQAVKQLFPNSQVTIGPVIDDGFYYDFSMERPFTPDDLTKIEKRMAQIVKQNLPITRSVMSRDEAVKFFSDQGEAYKAEIIESIPADQDLSLYTQGDFTDLCRGPHVPNTSKLKAFKLMKIAGAYWRGDSKNEMLQRIYGTAWVTKDDLKDYLFRLEEAEKRDHRKLAKKMDLFHLQEDAPGMVFWHPNGWTLYQAIEQYMRRKQIEHGYDEIKTPIMADIALWKASGHADKYLDDMFLTESENREYAIKPMNCPCHVQVYNQGLKSYRDLPIRLAEFGSCHRNESSGALHGLMRVRGFVQDDAHIFCTEAQVQDESVKFMDMLYEVYRDFGLNDVIVRLSTRPENRHGSDEVWDKAEKGLADALDAKGLDWEENPGEGAFYGPKIEFSFRDCLGRVWQLGTLQLDLVLPERLNAQYVDESGERRAPVMLHRAIFGSLERFIGILLEHYAEGLPAWLAPVQAVIMNITDKQAQYCEEIAKKLKYLGVRAKLDLRNEKIGYKIREHTIARVPYLIVIGDKEVDNRELSVRTQSGDDLGSISIDALAKLVDTDFLS